MSKQSLLQITGAIVEANEDYKSSHDTRMAPFFLASHRGQENGQLREVAPQNRTAG